MLSPQLDGYAIGVTADRRAADEIEPLTALGSSVIHGPTMRTLPLGHDDGLRMVTQSIVERPPDGVIAVTGLGLRAWLAAAEVWGVGDGVVQSLSGTIVFAGTAASERALRDAGISTVRRIDGSVEDLVAQVVHDLSQSGRVVLEQPSPVEFELGDALRQAGIQITPVPVYEWTLPDDIRPALRLIDAAANGTLHAVTFTSAPAMQNLFMMAAEYDLDRLLRSALNGRVIPMCVGPICLAAAERCGVRRVEIPSKYRIPAMVEGLARLLDARTRRFRFAGHEVVLRGSVMELDTERVELGDREASLLAALTSSPGSLLSKRQLLVEVWGSRTANDHVVEVTVARLRRRLGACADAIVAVPRRGYRFEGISAA
ncbi:MAG: uroporphyrinogen-III synthase [Ilumatobacteraceae bacterium]